VTAETLVDVAGGVEQIAGGVQEIFGRVSLIIPDFSSSRLSFLVSSFHAFPHYFT
jgi:ubiquinone/menaquinone biosynthesis C-methylase UbiE